MSDSEAILASLGIVAGVGDSSSYSLSTQPGTTCQVDTPFNGLTITFAIFATVPWSLLAYLAFKLRRILAQYIREHLNLIGSERLDYIFELESRVRMGSELRSVVTLTSGMTSTDLLEMQDVTPPSSICVDDTELVSVVVT